MLTYNCWLSFYSLKVYSVLKNCSDGEIKKYYFCGLNKIRKIILDIAEIHFERCKLLKGLCFILPQFANSMDTVIWGNYRHFWNCLPVPENCLTNYFPKSGIRNVLLSNLIVVWYDCMDAFRIPEGTVQNVCGKTIEILQSACILRLITVYTV